MTSEVRGPVTGSVELGGHSELLAMGGGWSEKESLGAGSRVR